jgi:hypothetical protein
MGGEERSEEELDIQAHIDAALADISFSAPARQDKRFERVLDELRDDIQGTDLLGDLKMDSFGEEGKDKMNFLEEIPTRKNKLDFLDEEMPPTRNDEFRRHRSKSRNGNRSRGRTHSRSISRRRPDDDDDDEELLEIVRKLDERFSRLIERLKDELSNLSSCK